jgi:hypothetical protein
MTHQKEAPILGTWTRVYWLVLLFNVALIAFFYFLTRYYS